MMWDRANILGVLSIVSFLLVTDYVLKGINESLSNKRENPELESFGSTTEYCHHGHVYFGSGSSLAPVFSRVTDRPLTCREWEAERGTK